MKHSHVVAKAVVVKTRNCFIILSAIAFFNQFLSNLEVWSIWVYHKVDKIPEKGDFMKKLLLSLLALCAVTMATSQISAKAEKNGDGQYQRVHQMCGACGHQKAQCKCAMQVCQKEVTAVEEVPLKEHCVDESYCEEGTREEMRNGKKVCIKTIAHEEEHKPICNRVCNKICPVDYQEKTVSREKIENPTPGRTKNKHMSRNNKMMSME
jgi:hypothetical protein